MPLHLTFPTPDLATSYLTALEEGLQCAGGQEKSADEIAAIAARLPAHLTALNEQGGTMVLPNGAEVERVPYSQLWLTDGALFLGVFNLRYRLNPSLRRRAGHIGYSLRPSCHGQGFATVGLALMLAHAARAGIGRLLLTCDDRNQASARVIEKNGGRLESVMPDPDHGGAFRRYWISTD
jgi:predicted acetyltransferase